MRYIIIALVIGLSLTGCSFELIETCGDVTSYGTNFNGGYIVLDYNETHYVDDLFFSTVDIGDYVCVTH